MTGHGTVVLIGPVAVGKSTIGTLVADRLGRPFVDLDVEADARYYGEIDAGVERLIEHAVADGYPAAAVWWQPARLHAVRRVLADHAGAVIALGAGHSHYEHAHFAAQVADALAESFVVFLVPSDDVDASTSLLRARCVAERGADQDWLYPECDYLREWVASSQNRALADAVVHTGEHPPDEVVELVVAAVSGLVGREGGG